MQEVATNSFIVEFPNALTPDQCDAIVSGFNALNLTEYGPSVPGKVEDRRCCPASLDHHPGMVVFPVNWPHLHAGHTPVSDDKYIITGVIRLDHGQRQQPQRRAGDGSAHVV